MAKVKPSPVPKTDIEQQVEADTLEQMKPRIPPRTAFGDDNIALIEAEIAVLRGEKTAQDFEDEAVDIDPETDMAASEAAQRLVSAAYNVQEWMAGEKSADQPSEGWRPLLRAETKK